MSVVKATLVQLPLVDDKLTHLASNGTPGMEDFLPLARFKGNLFGTKGSSNHQ